MDSKTLALIAALALAFTGTMMTEQNLERQAFDSYKSKFSKVYDEAEDIYRFAIYTAKVKEIEEHNARTEETYTMGINQFTDMTKAEFRNKILMTRPERKNERVFIEEELNEDVGSINWVTKGGVQHVKDQGQCGSCWAFSAAAGTEGAKFVRTGVLGDFSEQELVSCDYSCYGCNGGWNDYGMDYYAQNGICTESSYPYTSGGGSDGYCQDSSCTKDSFTISGTSAVSASVSGLQSANNQYPVSICVDASNWDGYQGGVFSSCGTQIDHCVLLAGYSGNSYWLVKNSWGTSWGESGYIRLQGGANTCGLTQEAYLTTA